MTQHNGQDGQRVALTPPATGLKKAWRRLRWSVAKRLCPGRALIVRFDGDLKMALRSIDRLGKAVYLKGYSDRTHAEFLHRALRPGMVYFDVGAHMGQFTLIGSKRVGPAGRVHAFEATSETFGQLQRNVALNGLTNVTLNRAAIFEKPGVLELQVCVRGKGEFNAIGKPLRPEEEVVGVERVPGITIDDYCRENGVGHIDLMKIDTNGAELQVIRGARRTLRAMTGLTLVVEFNRANNAGHGYRPEDLRNEFESLGYALYRLDDAWGLSPEPRGESYDQTIDLIATRDVETLRRRLTEQRQASQGPG
ncbi:MAG: FkbM family methyltransferase [Phycisphaeraceae bacterium]